MASRLRVSLGNLKPAPGSLQKQKRVGRGQGSGYGGTSGRGHNGQNSRSGPGPKRNFEGGQTPISKLFPKTGFYNQNVKTWAPVNLDRLQHWITTGRVTSSPDKPITARELLLSGCIHDAHDGIKILGDGSEKFTSKIWITPSRASKSAVKAIENAGGVVVCKYYNTISLKDCLQGRADRVEAAPTRREDIVWYGRTRNRGYISPEYLKKLDNVPFIEDRWMQLGTELSAWRKQAFDKRKVKSA
ncbi:ribosomal protein L15 [Cylindrobasidium torrendii FP15055 ss-10]|uniref:Ribosomal protein L15 n=1 Tax=Cylindrobasidium torrendii FP15055 ss-10 TaxID=1314674 RepID=A0A0D7B698_9AGAR|nr:ribosomal protein L15 [Cylindrobasidium torrendii FP15055 ss-10]